MHPLSRKLIDRSPRRLRRPTALVVRTVDGAMADRLPGLAAEIAFWALLSLPALLLTAIAATGLVAGRDATGWEERLIERILDVASVALTWDVLEGLVRPVLHQVVEGAALSVVSLGFLATVWTASRAVKVVLATTALTYGAAEPTGLRHRLLGFGITLVGLVVGLGLLPLLLAGPGFGEQLGDWTPDGEVVATLWRVLYWPTAVVVATLALASLYHLGAPWSTRWRRDLPGAVLATVVWLVGSAGLRLYGAWVLDGDSVYGPLAGPIVGLLWLWVSGFAVLLGAELNAQIEQVWPTGATERSPDATERSPDATERSPVATEELTRDRRHEPGRAPAVADPPPAAADGTRTGPPPPARS